MKKLTYSILACAAVASSAFAGSEMKEYKGPAPEPCFKDTELQLDIFGSYTDAVHRSEYGDGFGGGIGLNYFFTRNIGLGVSGNIYDGDVNGVWNTDLSVIARFPIENSVCIAPYILGGGGLVTDGGTYGTWHAGGGLEWRATPSFGIFGEGRYIWAEERDAAQVRLGARFVF
jgi:hypothetical protein